MAEENDWLGDICSLPNGTLVIPAGTKKLVSEERQYANAEGTYMTRDEYKTWSNGVVGREIDPAQAWFVEMGHGPVPDDVEL
ncbi:MAG: hypothetical protein ACXQT4_05720 [Methanotrichaceae archaeon]